MNRTTSTTEACNIPPAGKICLFGGSFDPIHLGHTHIAQQAIAQLHLDHLTVIPCHISPHKTHTTPTQSHHRLAMCQLATEHLPHTSVSDIELNSPTPSYSLKTATHFANLHPQATLYWLMGTDQWDKLHTWHHPEKLASLLQFIVFTRDAAPPQPRSGFTMHHIHGDHPASSTAIRDNIHTCTHWLHPQVNQYAQQHNLYPNPQEK